MQTSTNAANKTDKANVTLAKFDVSKLGAGRKVELEGDNAVDFVPDKAGFTAGTTLIGKFISTKQVLSDKLTTSKRNEAGKKYRNLHNFEDAAGVRFGVWGTGVLDALLKNIAVGKIISLTYKGRAKKAFQQGQQPAMEFDITEY